MIDKTCDLVEDCPHAREYGCELCGNSIFVLTGIMRPKLNPTDFFYTLLNDVMVAQKGENK